MQVTTASGFSVIDKLAVYIVLAPEPALAS